MNRSTRAFIAVVVTLLLGCDMPYKSKYEEAMRLKSEAERKLEETQAALSAEQNAIRRLYTED